jgi:hypothetical protein
LMLCTAIEKLSSIVRLAGGGLLGQYGKSADSD